MACRSGRGPDDLAPPWRVTAIAGSCSPMRQPRTACRRSPPTPCGSRSPRTAASSRSPRSAAPASIPPPARRLSESKAVSFRDAIFEAVIHHAYHDPRLVIYGEENRDWDGAFAVYRGLTESLPYHRLFNAPISEGAIVGTAVGYAMEGGRPLVELDVLRLHGPGRRRDLQPALQVAGHVRRGPPDARRAPRQRGQQVRRPALAGLERHDGPHPRPQGGLPGHPLRRQGPHARRTLAGTDPVVFFESQRLYGVTEWFQQEVPADHVHRAPRRPGGQAPRHDLTILTVGSTLYRAVEAADRLQKEFGLSAELIDARSLVPFDYAPVLESVQENRPDPARLRRLRRGAAISTPWPPPSRSCAFDDLDAPVVVVGAQNWITPAAEHGGPLLPAAELAPGCHPHPAPTPARVSADDRLLARGAAAGRTRGGLRALPIAIVDCRLKTDSPNGVRTDGQCPDTDDPIAQLLKSRASRQTRPSEATSVRRNGA